MAVKLRDILKRDYGGKETLELDPLTLRMMTGMLAKYRTDYPVFLEKVLSQAQGRKLKSLVRATAVQMKQAVRLLEVFLGAKKRLPTKEEFALAQSLFTEIGQAVHQIGIQVSLEKDLRERLNILSPNFERQMDAMQSASGLFAKRVGATVERKGGWSRMIAPVKEATELTGGFLGGIGEEMRTSIPKSIGGGIVGTGLAAVLGPFAPLATAAFTGIRGGIRGVRGVMEARRYRRDMMQLASISPGLAAKELGVGEETLYGMAGSRKGLNISTLFGKGQEPISGFGSKGKLLLEFLGKRERGFSGSLSEKVITTAIVTGMIVFFNKNAFQARWTKKVIELLEGKELVGGFKDLLGNFAGAIAGLIPLIKALGSAAAIAGSAWLGWQAGRWLGENIELGGKKLDEHVQGMFEKIFTAIDSYQRRKEAYEGNNPRSIAIYEATRMKEKGLQPGAIHDSLVRMGLGAHSPIPPKERSNWGPEFTPSMSPAEQEALLSKVLGKPVSVQALANRVQGSQEDITKVVVQGKAADQAQLKSLSDKIEKGATLISDTVKKGQQESTPNIIHPMRNDPSDNLVRVAGDEGIEP